uniref:Toll-like receptor 9 n=1 Tax=Pundamilia nyererei TaxID=303518 RepID=A0A3B4GD14_9CICH
VLLLMPDIDGITGLFPLVKTINTKFLPCDTNLNETKVDCSDRPLKHVPFIKATSVAYIDLSRTKINRVWPHAFTGVPNLHTLKLSGNCQPGSPRALEDRSCRVKVSRYAFKPLLTLKHLDLSGNSLAYIPWLPASLEVLHLENNQIFNIIYPLNTPHLEKLFLSKNCFYANPCNQSFYISEKVFQELPKLKNLTLGYNNLTAIPKGLPLSLESLDLRENTITEVLEKAFFKMTALEDLNLEWNCQRCDHAARPCFPCPHNQSLKLHSNSFYSENSSITILSLRGNSLKTFPKDLFRPLKKLKILDLSDNLLAHAMQNGTFFKELTGVKWLSLIYNYEPLKTFPELNLSPYFNNMSDLQYLLLSGNFFLKFSGESVEVLSKLKSLRVIELRMNFINTFNMTFVKQLPSLTSVDLSQNMLNFLECSSISRPGTVDVNLYAGSLHNQPLTLMDRDVTSRNSVWETDPLNALEMLEDSVTNIPTLLGFQNFHCKNKLTFDLSQNDIVYLNKHVVSGMENAICLDLSFNYMNQALRGGVFEGMTHLEFLNLSYNRLDLYYNDAFRELNSSLKILDISNNDFHFNMRGMGHRFEFLENLNQLEALSLANNAIGMRINQRLICNSLKYFDFSGNHLNIMWDSDNNKYTNFFQNLTNLTYLDISNNHLKSLSSEVLSNLPSSLRALIVSSNSLNYFPWLNISALTSLHYLNLNHNFLYKLPNYAVIFGVNFTFLDLSHNRLSYIPEDFFNNAKSLKHLYLSHNQIKELNREHLPVLFKNGTRLENLTLHANPFKCDCNTSWLADFLSTTPVHIPYLTTDVRCEFPESQQGESILSMDQRSCQDIYGSVAFVACSFMTLVFTVLPLLKHLYGWDMWYCLQVLWAGHKGYSQIAGTDSHYQYDAFVVFDTSNQAVRDWVYNELTVNLENSGHRRFCLCLEERDWIPGLSCIENLHNAVYRSVKTIFVLSRGVNGNVNGVIRQAFFMVQQRLLDEKVDVAVLVLMDKIFPKLKYLQLRKRLCRKSVLSWPHHPCAQPLFWNQMRMALSSDNLKFYDNNMSESFI